MPQDDRRPPYAAYVLAALLSFAALTRGAYDAWSATLLHLAALAFFAVLVAARTLGRGRLSVDLWPFLAAALTAFALSSSEAGNPSESFHAWRDWAAAFLLFLTARSLLDDDRSLDALLAGMVPVFLLEAAAVLHHQATGLFFREQPGGTMINANVLAVFLLLWLPMLVHKVKETWSKDVPLKPYWRLGLAANLTALLFTYSTWAQLCLLAAIPLFVGLKNTWKLLGKRPVLVATVLSAGAGAAAFLVYVKFTRTLDLEGHPLAPGENFRRLGWWLAGLRMFADRPWLGVGPGNFSSAYLAYQSSSQHTRFAHAFPVTLLAETGLAGTAALLALLAAWAAKLAAKHPGSKRVACAWGLLLAAIFSSINLGMEILANLAAAGVLAAAALSPDAGKTWKPKPLSALLAAALALFAAPYAAAPFLAGRNCAAGEKLAAAGNLQGALRAYSGAASMDPLSPEARRGLAKTSYALYRASGDRRFLKEALRHQRRAAELDSLSGALLLELHVYQKEAGDPGAGETLKRAARLDKGNPRILKALASFKPS